MRKMARNQSNRGQRVPELRRQRARQAWTQEELAQEAGVGVGTISRLEAGMWGAYPKTVRKLAAALGVEPRCLYGREEG
jgi:transcriptional regulator with XRE-family HTH domain